MHLSPSKAIIGLASIVAVGSLATSALFGNVAGETGPVFVPPSPCNDIFFATPGNQLCFNIAAFDADGGDIVMDWNDVPFVGAFTIPPTVFLSPGGTAQLQFCYTPTAQDTGMQFQVEFFAFNPDAFGDGSKCDVTIIVEAVLSAELESFTGKLMSLGGPIQLNWSTSSEIDNALFNIYRSETTFENATQINQNPIVALGSPITGADYSQIDRRVTAGHTYKYWLESIDIYGATQLFGPVTVSAR
jgi:hypothetical protein